MAQVEKHVSHRPLRPDYSRAHEAKSLRSEIGYTLRLGGPLALGELGWMSTYIVDALMIGRLANSPLAISASSLGNTIFYAIVFCAIYLMNGLETLIAQARRHIRRRDPPGPIVLDSSGGHAARDALNLGSVAASAPSGDAAGDRSGDRALREATRVVDCTPDGLHGAAKILAIGGQGAAHHGVTRDGVLRQLAG
jgi:hypothetical protein